ncbi:MAG: tRNA (N(6)-L-threonylcarbamoyladenosine(37)-C(2))-methylthiotransferase MtaB [Bacteroidales bacterium]|nr:tRNA (N(6)-L-threonylcarbamoyladenosine(37)-C(2))-methylthiotransferase MtaB [Bacteroidales bacterium]MDT8430260.1 tRNA (N(6)-L-threonylcarbamoyladenosine(37)-C(2))-methylthiotransferase MtaB [Bacteroidales bacterium]
MKVLKTVAFKTLGCRLNQFETDALVTGFHNAGYHVVEGDEKADVTVINTCTVTNQSDQKSRHTINHAAAKNRDGLVVVTGCMADNYKEKLEGQEQITYVVDNDRKSQIVELVNGHFTGEIIHPDKMMGDRFGFDTVQKSLHTRTSVKIQDGCDNFCTFCIIPSVRGRAVSRPVKDVLDNVRRVVDNGFKEVVITGVNIGRYDDEGLTFENVVEQVLELPGDFRVRISSLEPDGFSEDFHQLFSHPKLAPHLHLCLQSGSGEILLKMRRMYSANYFMETVERFRKAIPDFNFTTDVIVGFPGETDDDFQKTVDFIREAKFSHVHTFRFSRRTGTRADRMKEQVSGKVMAERSEVIRKISEENRHAYMHSMQGKEQRVLIEKVAGGMASGYGEHYMPVAFAVEDPTTNRFEQVRLTGTTPSADPVMQGTLI